MKRVVALMNWIVVLLLVLRPLGAQDAATQSVQKAEVGKTVNVHTCGSLFLAGQPTPEDAEILKATGIERVISLRMPDEIDWDEKAVLEKAGIEFVSVPLEKPEALTDDVLDDLRGLLREAKEKPTMLHCGSANRVGAVWLTHRVLDENVPLDTALQEAKTVGLRSPEYEARALEYIQRQSAVPSASSVRPGINDSFLRADLDIEEWLGRFEVESREIFAARREVLEATEFEAGDRVADVGAGTGLFTRLFSAVVGPEGWVYAVDISPRFIEHINKQAEDDQLTNVTAVLCPQDSITLPPESIDAAFVCDTYHHFEYPQATLASIHRALRSGGTLIVIDFERIAGESSDFVLSHVRAGKDVFRSEIEEAGFEFVEEVEIEALKENYFLRFRKP